MMSEARRPRADAQHAIEIIDESTEVARLDATAATGIRDGAESDAEACAAIYHAWVAATAWMPKVHAREEVAAFYRRRLFRTCRVLVAERDGRTAGFLAVDGEGFVAALYVAAQARGRGVGSALVRAAQAIRPEGLTLWTFAANAGARRFYGRLGFEEVGGTAGENDEGLPDVQMTWRAA